MKTLLRKALRSLWSLTFPARRPFARKVRGHLDRTLAPLMDRLDHLLQSVDANAQRLESLERRLGDTNQLLAAARAHLQNNLGPVGDGILRDLARLQVQIDLLRTEVSALPTQAKPRGLAASLEKKAG